VETLGEVATFYEVSSPRGVAVYRYADAFQSMVRIHTQQTDRDIAYIVTEAGDEIVVPLAVD